MAPKVCSPNGFTLAKSCRVGAIWLSWMCKSDQSNATNVAADSYHYGPARKLKVGSNRDPVGGRKVVADGRKVGPEEA